MKVEGKRRKGKKGKGKGVYFKLAVQIRYENTIYLYNKYMYNTGCVIYKMYMYYAYFNNT